MLIKISANVRLAYTFLKGLAGFGTIDLFCKSAKDLCRVLNTRGVISGAW